MCIDTSGLANRRIFTITWRRKMRGSQKSRRGRRRREEDTRLKRDENMEEQEKEQG